MKNSQLRKKEKTQELMITLQEKNLILESVSKNGLSLKFICETFQNDKEIALAAINENLQSFEFISEDLKNDPEFIIELLHIDSSFFWKVNHQFILDQEFVLKAIQRNPHIFIEPFINRMYRKNKKVVLAAIKSYAPAMECVDEDLLKNREFILEAVGMTGYALKYADPIFSSDPEIVMKSIQIFGECIQFASDELRNNKIMAMHALKNYHLKSRLGNCIQHLSEDLKRDIELIWISKRYFKTFREIEKIYNIKFHF
jgi:hypothetical protein